MTTVRNIRRQIRRRLPFVLPRGMGGASGIEALALVLLYVGGIILVPAAHKATVSCGCSEQALQAYTLARNARAEVVVAPSTDQAQHHDPLTCPICQLASTSQIVGHSLMPLASWHVVVANVCVTERVYRWSVQANAHRPRGPPVTACEVSSARTLPQQGGSPRNRSRNGASGASSAFAT